MCTHLIFLQCLSCLLLFFEFLYLSQFLKCNRIASISTDALTVVIHMAAGPTPRPHYSCSPVRAPPSFPGPFVGLGRQAELLRAMIGTICPIKFWLWLVCCVVSARCREIQLVHERNGRQYSFRYYAYCVVVLLVCTFCQPRNSKEKRDCASPTEFLTWAVRRPVPMLKFWWTFFRPRLELKSFVPFSSF